MQTNKHLLTILLLVGLVVLINMGVGSAEIIPNKSDVMIYIDRTINNTYGTIKITNDSIPLLIDSFESFNYTDNYFASYINVSLGPQGIYSDLRRGLTINNTGHYSITSVSINSIRVNNHSIDIVDPYLNVSLYITNTSGGIIGSPLLTYQIPKDNITQSATYGDVLIPFYYNGLVNGTNYSIILYGSNGTSNSSDNYGWATYLNSDSHARIANNLGGGTNTFYTTNSMSMYIFFDSDWFSHTESLPLNGCCNLTNGTGMINQNSLLYNFTFSSSSGGSRTLIKNYGEPQDIYQDYNYTGIGFWLYSDGSNLTIDIGLGPGNGTFIEKRIQEEGIGWKYYYLDYVIFPRFTIEYLQNISQIRFKLYQTTSSQRGIIMLDDIQLLQHRKGAFGYNKLGQTKNQWILNSSIGTTYITASDMLSTYAFAYTEPNSFHYHNASIAQVLKDSIDLHMYEQMRTNRNDSGGTWAEGGGSASSGYWLSIGRPGRTIGETYLYLDEDATGKLILDENITLFGINKSRRDYIKEALNLSAQWSQRHDFPNIGGYATYGVAGANSYNQYISALTGLSIYKLILNDNSLNSDYANKLSQLINNQYDFGNFEEVTATTTSILGLDGYVIDQLAWLTSLYFYDNNNSIYNIIYKMQNVFLNEVNSSLGTIEIVNASRGRNTVNFGYPPSLQFSLMNITNASMYIYKQAIYNDYFYSPNRDGTQVTNYTMFSNNVFYNYSFLGGFLPYQYDYFSTLQSQNFTFPRAYNNFYYDLYNGTSGNFVLRRENTNYFDRPDYTYPKMLYAYNNNTDWWIINNESMGLKEGNGVIYTDSNGWFDISDNTYPIWFSSSSSTEKHIASNLSDAVNVDVIFDVDSCENVGKITYIPNGGSSTIYNRNDYTCESNQVTLSSIQINPSASSNEILIEYGCSTMTRTGYKLVMIFASLIIVLFMVYSIKNAWIEGTLSVSKMVTLFIMIVISLGMWLASGINLGTSGCGPVG